MRKTVLILGHSYPTQFIDIFNQYTRLFDPHYYEVTVAYLTGETDETVKTRTLAEHVLFLNIPKKNIRGLKITAIYHLLKLCRQKKFQIVICHRYKPTYIMLWVAQFLTIPAIIGVMHELKTMSSWGRRLLIAALLRKNNLLAGVSNAVRDDIRKDLAFLPKEKMITLYNVIDIELSEPQLFFRDIARKALNLSPDDFVFGNIARLAPNKDQKNLIRAFALIHQQCPHAKLLIIGEGQLEIALKQQVAELKLQDKIIFTGFLPQAAQYMRGFDCFILSSIQEAFGRVLLEAMIAKQAIIATRVNGIPEVIAHTGLLIPAKDIDEAARAMQYFYQISLAERKQHGEEAYQRAVDYFSIPIFHRDFWRLPLLQSLT